MNQIYEFLILSRHLSLFKKTVGNVVFDQKHGVSISGRVVDTDGSFQLVEYARPMSNSNNPLELFFARNPEIFKEFQEFVMERSRSVLVHFDHHDGMSIIHLNKPYSVGMTILYMVLVLVLLTIIIVK